MEDKQLNKGETKIIIVGAGPAGLTAAYELLKQSDKMHPFILEECNIVGGISRTILHNGNRMDLGGHRFFSRNDMIMQWWEKILPIQGAPSCDDILLGNTEKELSADGPDPEKTNLVMLVRRRVSRIFFLRNFFDYPISIRWQTFKNMGFTNTIRVCCGYVYASLFKRREKSLEDFYINRFGRPLYSLFFEGYTEKVWGVHPSLLGADWGAQRVKGLSLMKVLADIFHKAFSPSGGIHQKKTETSLIEQFIYPKYGPGQLWETVADEIQQAGGTISLNSLVEEINIEHNLVQSVVVKENGSKKMISCDCLLSSMPVKDLVRALRGINIPDDIKDITENLPYRDFITVGLLVDRLQIQNKTRINTINRIVPDTWIYIQERDVHIGRLQIFNNWSPYMVADYRNKVWIGLEYFCTEGDQLWNMPDNEFIQFAIDELDKLQIIHKDEVRDTVRIKVKKAYPAYFGSYAQLTRVTEFLNGIENLYCIGRNGQHRYNNMDHSMLTAMEAVKCIISGNHQDKYKVWLVNTEKEYHEAR